jgi:hypothetical protein
MTSLPGLTGQYSTIVADPPWRFQNRTGKNAPEHKRLHRYATMSLQDIADLPVRAHAALLSHLYLWVPNALLAEGLDVMAAWGFTYKTNRDYALDARLTGTPAHNRGRFWDAGRRLSFSPKQAGAIHYPRALPSCYAVGLEAICQQRS